MLEIRQRGGVRELVGRFPYRAKAVISDRGRVRKESLAARAFAFAIDAEPTRRIDVLVGHDFGKPIASRQSGTLAIQDGDDAVTFVAQLPNPAPSCLTQRCSYQRWAIRVFKFAQSTPPCYVNLVSSRRRHMLRRRSNCVLRIWTGGNTTKAPT